MAPKRNNVLLTMVAIFLCGSLVGYASLQLVSRQPAEQDEKVPYVTPESTVDPDSYVNKQDIIDNPGGYAEPEMMFRGYLGIHNDRIAIFQGTPPNGILQNVTEYEVRDDVREHLEAGIPFQDIQEMLSLLENYTT